MDTAEIAALLRPYAELDEQRLALTLMNINLLLKWNARVNLTAVRDAKEIVQRHFGESFFAARHLLSPEDSLSVIDLGSGAGFPGLPLAIDAPKASVTLIESNSKKAAFLNEVIRNLNLPNASVFSQRAETYQAQADIVTMRAVEKFEEALPLASRLVAPKGRLALMVGAGQVDQARSSASPFTWNDPIPVPGGHSRVLLVGINNAKVE
jgi:16S rRNA (guanine527-N7)-methyltransferase